MDEKNENALIECHILMAEALDGYDDVGIVCERMAHIREYESILPSGMYQSIDSYVRDVIRPLVFDLDYWSFLRKDQYGATNDDGHYIVNSENSLEMIIFAKYHHILDLKDQLNAFMKEEFGLNVD